MAIGCTRRYSTRRGLNLATRKCRDKDLLVQTPVDKKL